MNAAAAVTNAITSLSFPSPIGHPFAQTENPRRVIESLRFPSTSSSAVVNTVSLSLEPEFPPNALRKKQDSSSRCGFSLGVDLGLSRTGLAISKGFVIRPLTVCMMNLPLKHFYLIFWAFICYCFGCILWAYG